MVYLPDYVEYQYVPGQPLKTLFPTATEDALDLLSKMFSYDPKARISAQQALEHRYVSSLSCVVCGLAVDVGAELSLFIRYFSSGPLPTEPALLPRPPPKRESANPRVSDFNSRDGPVVLSPPRKSRRVMPQREGFEANMRPEKMDGHGNAGERSEQVPMSLDFSVFGMRPPTRPTINRYSSYALQYLLLTI